MGHPCDVEGMTKSECLDLGVFLGRLTAMHETAKHPDKEGGLAKACKRHRLSVIAFAAHMMYLAPADLEDVKSVLERHRKVCTCENSPRDSQ